VCLLVSRNEIATYNSAKFQTWIWMNPPDVKSITGWYSKFKETGSVGDRKRTGGPSVSEETVDAEHNDFQRSPQKSTRHASHELRIPQSAVANILHKGCVCAHSKCSSFKPWSQTIIPNVLRLLRRCCNEMTKTIITLRLDKGPNWVAVFSPTFTWGRKQIQFPKRRVL
jgi:hypothetical protein